MSISHSLARTLSTAAAACSILAAAAPTQAAVIASFDPAFGPTIPNLGFRGSITLDVAPACYTLGSGFHATGGSCQITAQSAQVNYYNATTNSGTLTTVTLGASFFAPTYVFGAYFDPLTGQLSGFDTSESSIFGVSVTDSSSLAPIGYSGNMDLFFQSGFAPSQIQFAPAIAGVGAAYLRNCTSAEGSSCGGGQTSLPARLTFTTVPEPDSIALALLGVVGLVVARRHKPTAR